MVYTRRRVPIEDVQSTGTSRKILDSSHKEERDAIYFHGDKVSIERLERLVIGKGGGAREEEEEEENAIESSFDGIFKSFPGPGTTRRIFKCTADRGTFSFEFSVSFNFRRGSLK